MVKGYGYYDGTGLPKINIVHKDDSSIYPDVMKSFEFGTSVLFEEEKLRIAKVKPGIPGAFEFTTTVCTDNMSAGKKARWLVKKIIFNPPATIIFWSDGTKTVVKAHKEPFDPEKGIAMAFFKRFVGVYGKCSASTVMNELIQMSDFEKKDDNVTAFEKKDDAVTSLFKKIDVACSAIEKFIEDTGIKDYVLFEEEVPKDGK